MSRPVSSPQFNTLNFVSPSVIYFVTSWYEFCDVYHTVDSGKNWSEEYHFPSSDNSELLYARTGFSSSFLNPAHGYIFGTDIRWDRIPPGSRRNGNWAAETTDSGKTWDNLWEKNEGSGEYVVARFGNVIFLGGANPTPYLARFNTIGDTYEVVFPDSTISWDPSQIVGCSVAPNQTGLLAIRDTSGQSHILRTTKGGTKWSEFTNNYPSSDSIQFVVCASPDKWYVGGERQVYSSTDSGVTWSSFLSRKERISSLAVLSGGNIMYALPMYSDYILKSADGGKT